MSHWKIGVKILCSKSWEGQNSMKAKIWGSKFYFFLVEPFVKILCSLKRGVKILYFFPVPWKRGVKTAEPTNQLHWRGAPPPGETSWRRNCLSSCGWAKDMCCCGYIYNMSRLYCRQLSPGACIPGSRHQRRSYGTRCCGYRSIWLGLTNLLHIHNNQKGRWRWAWGLGYVQYHLPVVAYKVRQLWGCIQF